MNALLHPRKFFVKNTIFLKNFSTRKFLVPDRGYLEISGKDAVKFLQGLCTNDMNKLKTHGDCIAAAFLSHKGRIIADTLLYLKETINKENISKNSVIIELHISAIDILTKHLKTYKLRSSVIIKSYEYITILENDLLLMNEKKQPNISQIDKIEHQDKDNLKNVSTDSTAGDPCSNPDTGLILSAPDPRISSLGQRHLYISNNDTKNTAISTTLFDYQYLRLLYGINEGLEIVDKIPLECNLDLLNYIDFAKGCYVGQELTARTKFKGLVRKRILPLINVKYSEKNQFLPLCDTVLSTIYDDMSNCVVNSTDLDSKELNNGDNAKDNIKNDIKSSDIKKIYSINDSKIVELLGECSSSHGNSVIANGLIRLEKILPKDSSCIMNKCILVDNNVDIKTLDLASENTDSGYTGGVFVAFRPPWWLDLDPITHKRLDTHED
mmetsp:Transcript_16425/g.15744  ORF Transcript_16425/g.15744 Transcript_16425/m.15744 type:complete len:439 (+) Transcript_16425:224-1540(+)